MAMDAVEFTESLAESFEKFMTEAQLSSAISVVIDDGVLSDANIKPSVLQRGLMMFIKDLQNLHDACDPLNAADDDERTRCWNCRREKQSQAALDIDPSIIQITADNTEIDKRIRAFIERKQVEKDDTNRREFCAPVIQSQEDTCARTDAVFTSQTGGKSHVKVSKVVNKYGPQTRPALVSLPAIRPSLKRARTHPDSSSSGTSRSPAGVEERLHNMEAYLKIKPEQNMSSDVFQRLKTLEDRLLHLESISPEYSHISSFMSQQHRGDSVGKAPGGDMVQDIDNRIMELQRSLRVKKARMEMESSAQKKTET